MSDRLALLERAQQGDDRAEAQLLTENAGIDLVHRPSLQWLRCGDG